MLLEFFSLVAHGFKVLDALLYVFLALVLQSLSLNHLKRLKVWLLILLLLVLMMLFVFASKRSKIPSVAYRWARTEFFFLSIFNQQCWREIRLAELLSNIEAIRALRIEWWLLSSLATRGCALRVVIGLTTNVHQVWVQIWFPLAPTLLLLDDLVAHLDVLLDCFEP